MKNTKIKFYLGLANLLDYNPNTGTLTWKESYSCRYGGKQAGYIHDKNNGYRKVKHKNKRYACHILAWIIYYGKIPEHQIDHIDGNPDNNKIDNLRDVTPSLNQRNSPRKRLPHIAMAGVEKVGNKWRVSCCKESLGYFHCLGVAIKARKSKETELGGFTKRHSTR